MKKVSFENRNGVRIYILHEFPVEHVNVVKVSEDGWSVITDTGEEITTGRTFLEKGEVFIERMENEWYKVQEDLGYDKEHTGPWMDDPYLFDLGKVVTLEGTEDEQNYIFDGWCNLYPRPEGERGPLANDIHPHVALIFS